jgi:hypothetical protein
VLGQNVYLLFTITTEIQTKVFRVFLLAFTVTSTALPRDFYIFQLTQPLTVSTVQLLDTVKEKGGKPVKKSYPLLYARNPCRNLKSEISQDNAQKPQRNCTFMNLASEYTGRFQGSYNNKGRQSYKFIQSRGMYLLPSNYVGKRGFFEEYMIVCIVFFFSDLFLTTYTQWNTFF